MDRLASAVRWSLLGAVSASVLVERSDGVVRYSKMGGIAIRTIEIRRRWNIARQVRDCGFPENYPLHQLFCTSLAGFLLKDIPYFPQCPGRRVQASGSATAPIHRKY